MIRIVTDSSCDLPPALAESQSITIVPLTIRFGDTEYTDREDLSSEGFWATLATSPRLPETAAPSAGAFAAAYRRLADEGTEGIVAVTLSSRMSATYQAAVLGAEAEPSIPVRVIDSTTVSMGLGLIALAAAQGAREGLELDALAEQAARDARRARLLAALDTLEMLRRGGRIGGAQALLGGLLDIKPLITVEDGVVSAAGKVRTRSKAVDALVTSLAGHRPESIALLHTNPDDVGPLNDRLATLGIPIVPCLLGAVVGTHTGPGTLGVAYLD
jgi:DegV family protein with EDD domain